METQLAEDRAKKTMIDTARLAGKPLSMDVDMMIRLRMTAIILILNIADELRAEQENANSCEKNRRALEFKVDNLCKTTVLEQTVFPQRICSNNALVQVKDLQVKLDEAEQQAMKGGRKVGMWSTM